MIWLSFHRTNVDRECIVQRFARFCGNGAQQPAFERNKETNLQGPKRMSLTPGVLAAVFSRWSVRASWRFSGPETLFSLRRSSSNGP